MTENKKIKTISIAIVPEVIKKLDDGNYNRSKLINSLLKYFFEKIEK